MAYPNVDQQRGIVQEGPVVGICPIKDTATLNMYLSDPGFMKNFPIDVKFTYTAKPYDTDEKFIQLIALRQNNRDGRPSMDGDVVTDATQTFDQFGSLISI